MNNLAIALYFIDYNIKKKILKMVVFMIYNSFHLNSLILDMLYPRGKVEMSIINNNFQQENNCHNQKIYWHLYMFCIMENYSNRIYLLMITNVATMQNFKNKLKNPLLANTTQIIVVFCHFHTQVECINWNIYNSEIAFDHQIKTPNPVVLRTQQWNSINRTIQTRDVSFL